MSSRFHIITPSLRFHVTFFLSFFYVRVPGHTRACGGCWGCTGASMRGRPLRVSGLIRLQLEYVFPMPPSPPVPSHPLLTATAVVRASEETKISRRTERNRQAAKHRAPSNQAKPARAVSIKKNYLYVIVR